MDFWSYFIDRFLKDSELLSPCNIQSSVVKHRGGFDFWNLLIHSFHPQASDTCHRDKTEAASLDDSIHRFPQFSTRLPCTTETFQMEDKVCLELPNSVWDSNLHHHGEDNLSHDHVEAFGRVNCLRGNSFLFSFHCQQHNPHTVLHAMFWDASRHRLGQPGFAPSDNINEACACLQVVQEARDCDWSNVQWCWRLIRFLRYQQNCRRAHCCWPHKVIHQLFQRLFHLGHHLSHRLHHLGCHLFGFRSRSSIGPSSCLCSPRLDLLHHLVDLQFAHFHLWFRVPHALVVPLILPCRFRLLVPSPRRCPAMPWQSPH